MLNRIQESQKRVIKLFKENEILLEEATPEIDNEIVLMALTHDNRLVYNEDYVSKLTDLELDACIGLTLSQKRYFETYFEKEYKFEFNVAVNISILNELDKLGIPTPADNIAQHYPEYRDMELNDIYDDLVKQRKERTKERVF